MCVFSLFDSFWEFISQTDLIITVEVVSIKKGEGSLNTQKREPLGALQYLRSNVKLAPQRISLSKSELKLTILKKAYSYHNRNT